MAVKTTEVSGGRYAEEIHTANGMFGDDFEPLNDRHVDGGFWWLVHDDLKLIGFAGMVEFTPFPRVGYLKRAGVIPAYRGRGIQQELMSERVTRAKSSTEWTHLVSECDATNVASANNFIRAGFRLVKPERPWAKDTLFWSKEL